MNHEGAFIGSVTIGEAGDETIQDLYEFDGESVEDNQTLIVVERVEGKTDLTLHLISPDELQPGGAYEALGEATGYDEEEDDADQDYDEEEDEEEEYDEWDDDYPEGEEEEEEGVDLNPEPQEI